MDKLILTVTATEVCPNRPKGRYAEKNENRRIPEELNTIVNEAISASRALETIASEIEHRGYEVLICLDLSPYAQVRKSTTPVPHFERTIRRNRGSKPAASPFQTTTESSCGR